MYDVHNKLCTLCLSTIRSRGTWLAVVIKIKVLKGNFQQASRRYCFPVKYSAIYSAGMGREIPCLPVDNSKLHT